VRAHGTGERSIARSRNLVDDSFLQRRSDRKRIVAPDGSEIVPTTKPHPDRTLVKALARAPVAEAAGWGRHATVREIAEAEGIGKSYVSRILRLALLAPDIVEAILEGRPIVSLPQLMKPLPLQGEEQASELATG
jgi:hypothetical protein